MIRLRRKYTSRQITKGQEVRKIYEGVSFFRGAPHIITDAKGLVRQL
jgi:hypothetical protein